MIFKRRERPPLWDRAREMLYPRKGVWRGMEYIQKRMRRLPDSPHRIALGFAAGALASFTPFFGFHFFVAAGIAWVIRGNIIAALFGTIVGNPITFPLISTTALYLGRKMMGRHSANGSDFDAVLGAFSDAFSSIWSTVQSWFGAGQSKLDGLVTFLDDVFLPYLIGGILPGIATAILSYFILLPIVAAYQERRRKKLLAAQEMRRRLIDEEQAAYAMADRREGDNA